MRSDIARLFTPDILAAGARRFGLNPNSLRLLGDHQSLVYSCHHPLEGEVILRFTHVSHRPLEWIAAELEWVDFLADMGVPAARPRESTGKRRAEVLGDGLAIACCFERAKGEAVQDGQLRPELFERLGMLLGRIHRVTQQFIPTARRPKWYELDAYDIETYLPPEAERFRDRSSLLLRSLAALPKSERTYGLIHADLHFGNVFAQDSRLTCFDFDSSQYHWLGYDIAAIVFFSARRMAAPARRLPELVSTLLLGYAKESDTEDLELSQLALFLAVRELAKCILYYKNDRTNRPLQAQRLASYRADIEQQRPFLDVNWSRVCR